MPSPPASLDQRLLQSWDLNAEAWTETVRAGRIPSRRAGTDAAIVAAVQALAPARLLDVGCGEGWLAHACARAGMDVVGVDGSAALVGAAQAGGPGTFRALGYAALIADPAQLGPDPFDAIVCNFALLSDDLVPLLAALRTVLRPEGHLVVQTVHPWTARGEAPYAEGWRTETFAAFGGAFPAEMPWYYRTLGGWVAQLTAAGFALQALHEPLHPDTGAPLSLLLVAVPA